MPKSLNELDKKTLQNYRDKARLVSKVNKRNAQTMDNVAKQRAQAGDMKGMSQALDSAKRKRGIAYKRDAGSDRALKKLRIKAKDTANYHKDMAAKGPHKAPSDKEMKKMAKDYNAEETKVKNCGCGKDPCETYGSKEDQLKEIAQDSTINHMLKPAKNIKVVKKNVALEMITKDHTKRLGDAVSRLKKSSDELRKASNRYLMSKGKFSADHRTPEQKKKSSEFLKKYNKDAAMRRREENKGLPKEKQWDKGQIKKDLGEGTYMGTFDKNTVDKYDSVMKSSKLNKRLKDRKKVKVMMGKKPKGINELDKSTLKSYIGKAQAERLDNINKMEKEFKRGETIRGDAARKKVFKRGLGVKKAEKKLGESKRGLSPAEKRDREDIVKGMKKNKTDFMKRYGRDHEAVMYATATKMAKQDEMYSPPPPPAVPLEVKIADQKKRMQDKKKKMNEAEFDAENPKRGIQRKRVNLQFGRQQRHNPTPFKKDQQQDIYKKSDSMETKIRKSRENNRFPDYRQNKDTGKIKSDFLPGGKRVKQYGGVKHKKTKPNVTATTEARVIHQLRTLMTEKKSLATEDLRDWFKDKWVRMDTKGNIKGDCAREPGEGKPKCLPQAKAHSMSKEDRAKAARRKRREDPVADRPGKGGKPINVKTEEKMISHEYSERIRKHGKMTDDQKKAVTAVYDKQPFDKKMAKDPHVKRAQHYMRTEQLNRVFEKCWDGWKQQGMKKKGKRIVPNCVKENFKDGKNPQDKGDAKRHGLSGKQSTSSLKKVRSSDSASPRKKQLAHWILNMRKGRNKKK